MSDRQHTIRYGRFALDLAENSGARLELLTEPPAAPEPRPYTRVSPPPVLLGRMAESRAAFSAVRAGRPLNIHAPCGSGVSTLLSYIVAAEQALGDRPCVMLRAGRDGPADLLQRLVDRLYAVERPVKLGPAACAGLIDQMRATVVLDDVRWGRRETDYLLWMLTHCSVLLGSVRPVLGEPGVTLALRGLPPAAAAELLSRRLGGPPAADDEPDVRRLMTAVRGRPLLLEQAAALVQSGRHNFAQLAAITERDPAGLGRLSISTLSRPERRLLAALALVSGVVLSPSLVIVLSDVANGITKLRGLADRGLAEQDGDRYGLPICQAATTRELVLDQLDFGRSCRELADWLAARDPTDAEAVAALDAAVSLLEYAAERRGWESVAQLARAAEPGLALVGRWEAWHRTLELGIEATHRIGDLSSEAHLHHQRGTYKLCQGDARAAQADLGRALKIRQQLGEATGVAATTTNLGQLAPTAAAKRPARPPRTWRRRLALALGGLSLVIGFYTLGHHPASSASGPTHIPTLSPAPTSPATPTGPASFPPPPTRPTQPSTSTSPPTSSPPPTTPPPPVNPVPKPSALDLGLVSYVGPENQTGTVTITNPSTTTIEISAVTPQSPNSAFTVTDGCTHSRLPPHGTCGLTAQFQPSTLGTSSQTLLVQESHGGSTEVTLTGTGYIELTVTLNGPNEVASDNHGLICADPQTSSTNCTTPLTSLSEQLTGHYGSVASPSTPPSPSNLLSLSWTGDCISAPSDRPVCTISKLPDGPPRGLTATLGPSGTPYPG